MYQEGCTAMNVRHHDRSGEACWIKFRELKKACRLMHAMQEQSSRIQHSGWTEEDRIANTNSLWEAEHGGRAFAYWDELNILRPLFETSESSKTSKASKRDNSEDAGDIESDFRPVGQKKRQLLDQLEVVKEEVKGQRAKEVRIIRSALKVSGCRSHFLLDISCPSDPLTWSALPSLLSGKLPRTKIRLLQ